MKYAPEIEEKIYTANKKIAEYLDSKTIDRSIYWRVANDERIVEAHILGFGLTTTYMVEIQISSPDLYVSIYELPTGNRIKI